jgi:2-desacetyl-2-hydroxyethyl bacteriochlorophyllide A dehydrogenase
VGRVVTLAGPRQVALAEEPEPELAADQVRVETLYSGISAGTELATYRGSNPHLERRWDPEQRLFEEGAHIPYPLSSWGYEEVGRITEVGPLVREVEPGMLVWGTWGHRSTAVVTGARASSRGVPTTVSPLSAVFARIGAVALNAVLDGDIHVGELVAVFGQGVAGLIAGQLAALNGGTVVVVDGIGRRLDLARELGAAHVIDVTLSSPAQVIRALTGGRGADVSLELSGSYEGLDEAIRATAYGSRVVAAGFYQGPGGALRLGEEFHHNRVELVASQISGVSARLAHRWSADRLEQTVMRLAAEGRLELEPLVSHVLPVENAAEAFRLLDERPEEAVQVVLAFT